MDEEVHDLFGPFYELPGGTWNGDIYAVGRAYWVNKA